MSHAVPGPADQDRDRRRPWWLWLLLGLLGVALLSLVLSRCGTDDDGNASTTTPGTTTAQTGTPATGTPTEPSAGASTPTTASSPASPSPGETSGTPASPEPSATATPTATATPDATATSGAGGGAGAGAGALVAGGTSVLADGGGNPATALAGKVGQNATATRARVQSVPADEGFWVGTSETDRAWVQLTGDAGESAYQVQEGDLVDFTGKVVAHDDTFASQVGVSGDEGSEQLIQQKAHVAVPKAGVKLSD